MSQQHRLTGRGRAELRPDPPSVLIFNFDVGGAQLKLEHQSFLRAQVVPRLKQGGSVSIVGLASRTGSTAFNQHLSQRRAERTLAFLRGEVTRGFVARNVIGFGEMKAKAEGVRDRTEDPRFRSVLVLTGSGAVPPPPPVTVDVSSLIEQELLPEADPLDTISKGIDIVGGVSGFFELVPWEAVAAFAGTVGGVLTLVGGIIQMPLLWKAVHDRNLKNGSLQGYWDAIQDMANAFSDPALDRLPLSRWPALPEPKPHSFDVPASVLPLNEREWMEGRKKGCEVAFKLFRLLEEKPAQKQGKTVTGRQILRSLYRQYGSRLADEIRRAYNIVLIREGEGDWPLRKP
jgi:hypothetical protein